MRPLSIARNGRMDSNAKLAVFKAQVENVRSLDSAIKQVKRAINAELRSNNQAAVDSFTKIYVLLFCSWAEANFSKVIHTPHAFNSDELAQIKIVKDQLGISEGWKKCVELGARHLEMKQGSFKPNALKLLNETIGSYVFDPSLIRNKLIHGQWKIALNRRNDNENPDYTKKILDLHTIKITGWYECHKLLASLVEVLAESPRKAFVRDWYSDTITLKEKMQESDNKTIERHTTLVRAKDARTDARRKRAEGLGQI